MDLKLREQLLEQTEEEIRSEMAAALGRIGGRLAEILRSMHELRHRITDANRAVCVREYNALREQAKLYYWYLIVQREAIGLRKHADVTHAFSIPEKLRES